VPDGFSNAALWKSAITHDQPRLCSERPGAIGTEAVDTDGSTSGCREHGLLVDAVGEFYQQMESRRDAPKRGACLRLRASPMRCDNLGAVSRESSTASHIFEGTGGV
jgi:hypothetical protein